MKLIFLCPDINKPSGGIKQIYRQVDILNNNGFNAFVLHEVPNFKCTWFNNKTQIIYNYDVFSEIGKFENQSVTLKSSLKKLKKRIYKFFKKKHTTNIGNNDILVFPEVYGPYLGKVLKGVKKVIYNQGVYQTFFKYNLDLNNLDTPYRESDLLAVIVNSNDAKNYLRYSFPNLKLFRLHYGIDKINFYFEKKKKKQIAFMPRRLRNDLVQVINILKFKGLLNDWELVAIDNMSETEVSMALRESAIFLSFSINEGFGMPPAEAMASGCIVVGYPGNGGLEFFKEDFSYPIPDRNIQEYVKQLESILIDYSLNNEFYIDKGKKASDFILNEYAMEVEKQDIVKIWSEIINL